MDNGLFLENQKFGVGDGKLHYYLYNYRAATIAGGLDSNSDRLDPNSKSKLGMLML
jgi:glycylpeptide N-tetradecanoyltransferase